MLLCALFYTGESSSEVETEADSSEYSRLHTRENQYTCTQCEKCLSSKWALYYHMNIHRGKYKCTECGRCFGSKYNLAVHMRSYSGEKPFECTVCGKRFTVSSHLVSHSRIHTGEKPYKCHVCNKAFITSSHLQRHKRRCECLVQWTTDWTYWSFIFSGENHNWWRLLTDCSTNKAAARCSDSESTSSFISLRVEIVVISIAQRDFTTVLHFSSRLHRLLTVAYNNCLT